MKDTLQTRQLQQEESGESEQMQSMAPPAFGLAASGVSNISPNTGQAIQRAADPNAPIQRRETRDEFPWQGVIDHPNGALFMLQPNVCTEQDISLPRGTRVQVLARNDWQYQVRLTDGTTGYVEVDHVDDAVSNHIEENMVGETMHWEPSGPNGSTDFAVAARENPDAQGAYGTPMPDVAASSVMNCWEMVLLAAYQVGVLSRDTLRSWYQGGNLEAMMPQPDGTYVIGDANSPVPQRGDLIFMNGLSHVVIAQGDRDSSGRLKVWSFWPPSDFSPADAQAAIQSGNIDSLKIGQVQDTTIEQLADWMVQMGLSPDPITFGTPAW
jgi:cell wall-associated NlpC family hydrolase